MDEIRDLVAAGCPRGWLFGQGHPIPCSLPQMKPHPTSSNMPTLASPNASLDVTCDYEGDELIITMRDNGKPFDPSKVKQPNLKADLSERQIGGLGMYLMRKLMDEVRYEANSRTGNLLTMIKRRG